MQRSRKDEEYAQPPSGRPPSGSRRTADEDAPRAGPPPSLTIAASSCAESPPEYDGAPSGPPPQQRWETVVPDTSLLPPPPSFFAGWETSPAQNATAEEAGAGERWCDAHALVAPGPLDTSARVALRAAAISLLQPRVHRRHGSLARSSHGVWRVRTGSRSRDGTMIGWPPLYAAAEHSPLRTGRPWTAYYEVAIRPDTAAADDVCLALGFVALPYPTFRLPGWHRGSLAVHGDDGHRYVNDTAGGRSFTAPFRRGEVVGIGITFGHHHTHIEPDVFFTRQGTEEGRWRIHEERDAADQAGSVEGLEGFHDLSCAVGTCGAVSLDIIFEPDRWLYKPAVG